ncbi:MAG: thiamine pyrophosphate-binding protein [Chloroflexota bacterium]|jgi:acetolactate synthase-1/2/3 large subunit
MARAKRVEGAAALVDILEREGVTAIFGVPGGPLLPLLDRLIDHPIIELILTKHEQAAAYAAFAYARATGRLGVCMATLGPGATNLVAGLPVAFVESAPVLAISGQVQSTGVGRGAHQESTGWYRTPDQEAMFRATCKHTATCTEVRTFADHVRAAIRIATSGRPGPAHLVIPADLLHQKAPYQPLDPVRYRVRQERGHDSSAIEDIAALVSRARFPLLFAGARAMQPWAGRQLEELSAALEIPLIADLGSKSVVDEALPLYLGCAGVMGQRAGERYLKDHADLVIAVGQSFDEITTLSWDPRYAELPLVVLDTDAEEVGKAFPVEAAAVGHLPTTVAALHEALREQGIGGSAERRRVVTELKRKYPLFEDADSRSEAVPLLPQRIVRELREALPDDALVLSDSSKWARWLGRYYEARAQTVVSAHDYEPMGWAVAGAIGAKVADRGRTVVSVSGDGAFLMSAMELATAANHDLAIVWVVMNDERYGIIHDLQKGLYGGRVLGSAYRNPDLVTFASAFGIAGQRVERPDELRSALRQALDRDAPALLDVRFDADAIPPVRPRSVLIPRGMGLPDPTPGPETTRALIKLLRER